MSDEPKVLHIQVADSVSEEEAASLVRRISEMLGEEYRIVATPGYADITIYDPAIFRRVENKIDKILDYIAHPVYVYSYETGDCKMLLENMSDDLFTATNGIEITD